MTEKPQVGAECEEEGMLEELAECLGSEAAIKITCILAQGQPPALASVPRAISYCKELQPEPWVLAADSKRSSREMGCKD